MTYLRQVNASSASATQEIPALKKSVAHRRSYAGTCRPAGLLLLCLGRALRLQEKQCQVYKRAQASRCVDVCMCVDMQGYPADHSENSAGMMNAGLWCAAVIQWGRCSTCGCLVCSVFRPLHSNPACCCTCLQPHALPSPLLQKRWQHA